MHVCGGVKHWVPADWCFPRCGVLDLWRQWWIGNTVRHIHLLCFLKSEDVEHLDRRIPLVGETAQHGQFGRQRWAVNKRILCYLRFLMNWIENKVETAGAREEASQLCLVNRMFEAGSQIILQGERDCQKSFLLTVVCAVFTRG